jgi:hypothetical protein
VTHKCDMICARLGVDGHDSTLDNAPAVMAPVELAAEANGMSAAVVRPSGLLPAIVWYGWNLKSTTMSYPRDAEN